MASRDIFSLPIELHTFPPQTCFTPSNDWIALIRNIKLRNKIRRDTSVLFYIFLFLIFLLLLFRFLLVYASVLKEVKLESAEKSERSYKRL